MSTYHYTALDPSGKSVKGLLQAESEHQAREQLRAKGFVPTQLKPHVAKSLRFSSVSKQDVALLTRQLATLLTAGIPIEEALLAVSEQSDNTKTRTVLLGVRAKIQEGFSLAQSLGEYPHIFPDLYRSTVGAGEQTGRLDVVLEKLADYTEYQQAMKQKIQQALIYPLLMVVVSFSIIAFLLSFVVPKMITVFSDSGQTLPLMTKVLIGVSHFVQSYAVLIIIILVAMSVALRFWLKNKQNKYKFHQFLLKLPVVAYLTRSLNVARYIHTFSILFAAGVNVIETMRISSRLIQNLPMQEAFIAATTQVKEGKEINVALKETGYLPPIALHLIANGEKSGHLPEMMKHAATHLDNEVNRLLDLALTLLEPFMILFMGGIVLFIVLATLLPIFSMEQLVG